VTLTRIFSAFALTATIATNSERAFAQKVFIECNKDNRSLGHVGYRYSPKGDSLGVGQKLKVERRIFEAGQIPTDWISESDLIITQEGVGYFHAKSTAKNEYTNEYSQYLFVTRLDGLGREIWARSNNWGVLHNSGWAVCEIKLPNQ